MTTKTILLINSESTVREVVQTCLSQIDGWRVLSASSPPEGLQRALLEQLDVILFDLSTFGMNFFTFVKKLRAEPATRTIPVVLITEDARWLNLELFQEFQIAGVLAYSADPAQLSQQLAAVLCWDIQPFGLEADAYDVQPE